MSEHPSRTPFEIYKAIHQTLNTDTSRINLVRRDQELILDGWQIYFAPDPYDIGDFCFPFSTKTLLRDLTQRKIRKISKLQNGRYEVMYNVEDPILLEPYEKELKDKLKWAQWSNFVSEDSELLDRYISMLRIQPGGQPSETKDRLLDLKGNYISSVIAVVTGIFSIGSKRLRDVMFKLKPPTEPPDHRPSKRIILDQRKEVVDKIADIFQTYFEDNTRFKEIRGESSDRPLLERSWQVIDDNNRRDARAVDQLLQLNQIYNKHKQLVLYFSSAPKSLYIDRDPELKKYYPIINGEPYDLVRTANDLFVYMVYKGDSEARLERSETARNNLKKLARLVETVEETRDAFEVASKNCLHCNEDVKKPRCNFGPICEDIEQYGEGIERRQQLNVNYSLQMTLADILDKTDRLPTPSKYRAFLNNLQKILRDIRVPTATRQEMEVTLQHLLNRVDFASAFIRAGRKEESRKVSCYLNSYPVFLSLKNEQLQQIVKKVVALFDNSAWSYQSFKLYVDEYLDFDEKKTQHPESELVRCFLYLIMGEVGKARQIAGIYLDSKREIDNDIRREFLYLMCFILWMAGEHQGAIELASEGIRSFARDGRFYHCRSAIRVSLLDKQPDQDSFSYNEIVDDTLAAIRDFSSSYDFPVLRHRLEGVCYNNLACYFSESEFKMVNVPLAEDYLAKLTTEIPEEDWDPAFPEFFHTKGSVLYAKFLTSPLADNRKYLDEAYRSAVKAFNIYPEKTEHSSLLKTIETTYERFRISKPELGKT
jgi:hypothetical protein